MGLYIHIPFCHRLCHYCDFVKTANFSDGFKQDYFSKLYSELSSWLEALGNVRFKSVFIGGGTPSIFSSEYAEIFKLIDRYSGADAEVTLETNPEDVTENKLKTWRSLGINRISLGIQSFDDQGLKVLTRDHNGEQAIRSVELAKKFFSNVSVDLIYGWKTQTKDQWLKDLELISDLGPNHASLYLLTYSGKTPFARQQRAGKMGQEDSTFLEDLYLNACMKMAEAGYRHEEVSNWSKDGFSCKHNWIYWQMEPYLAVGSGGHGFLPSGKVGVRYSYPPSLLGFINSPSVELDKRTADHWLMEYITTSLRTNVGISFERIFSQVGMNFVPSPVIDRALKESMIIIEDDLLLLTESEWFRENAWAFEVYNCFR